jgi:hypothetical protein
MVKKYFFLILIIIAATLVFWGILQFRKKQNINQNVTNSPQKQIQSVSNSVPETGNSQNNASDSAANSALVNQNAPKSAFAAPLDRAGERITKKPFGIYITPANSPVQPERFQGYHTGTDFEIFPEELNIDVPVKAICDGNIALKKYASGYGGVLVESCELNGQPVTVVYGHLKLASIQKNAGNSLAQGEKIGILGKAFSAETSGERKHLHLGIHKGASVNILGYVQSKGALSGWVDACSIDSVCK